MQSQLWTLIFTILASLTLYSPPQAQAAVTAQDIRELKRMQVMASGLWEELQPFSVMGNQSLASFQLHLPRLEQLIMQTRTQLLTAARQIQDAELREKVVQEANTLRTNDPTNEASHVYWALTNIVAEAVATVLKTKQETFERLTTTLASANTTLTALNDSDFLTVDWDKETVDSKWAGPKAIQLTEAALRNLKMNLNELFLTSGFTTFPPVKLTLSFENQRNRRVLGMFAVKEVTGLIRARFEFVGDPERRADGTIPFKLVKGGESRTVIEGLNQFYVSHIIPLVSDYAATADVSVDPRQQLRELLESCLALL